MTRAGRPVGLTGWLAVALLAALVAAAAHCGRDVVLGVTPASDAAVSDAGEAGARD